MSEIPDSKEAMNQFMMELAQKAKPKSTHSLIGIEPVDVVPMAWSCFEDIRRYDEWTLRSWTYWMEDFMSILQTLKGRTVKEVVWTNIKNSDVNSIAYNPLGNRGQFYIVLNPKEPEKS